MPAYKFRSSAPKPLPPLEEIDPELFWALVDIREPEECWEWKGVRNRNGYGVFRVGYRSCSATRISFYLTHKQDPLNLVVRHRCDRPPCANPEHLELGTQKQNMQDAVLRGRLNQGDKNGTRTKPESKALGEQNGLSKLNAAVIVHMRERFAAGDTCAALAKQFEVAGSLVARIIHGKLWKHVGGPIHPGRISKAPPTLLRREDAQRVIALRVEGKSVREICEVFHVSQTTIWPILYGSMFKDLDRTELRKTTAKKHMTAEQRAEIVAARKSGETFSSLAARFGMGISGIDYIVRQAKNAKSTA